MRGRGSWVGLTLAVVAACRPASEERVVVLAAASLTEAFSDLAAAYAARPGTPPVDLEFAGTQTLAAQLREGVEADAFAAADTQWMARVRDAGLVGEPRPFAVNRLVVVTPVDDPAGIATPADVARPGVRLVLAGPTVPAGRYAREALSRMGIEEAALRNVVSNAADVKVVASTVALGEADAGLVYATDVTPALRDRLRVLPLPPGLSPRAVYTIAVVAAAPHPEAAGRFLEFVVSAEGRRVLARHGMEAP